MTPKRSRVPWLLLSVLGLLLGLWLGLMRMGWRLPLWQPRLVGVHGPLMVAGFFGTLIALERAVALNRRWMYLAPGLAAAGMVLLALGQVPLAAWAFVLGSLVMLAVLWVVVQMQPGWHTRTMALGAAALVVGNVLWMLGQPYPLVVPWWAAFLVLTIAGERLELGRMLRPSRGAIAWYLGSTALYLVGIGLIGLSPTLGLRVHGLGMLLLALWLLRYDIARRTVRLQGLPRFIALCLLSGYFWLAGAGALALFAAPTQGLMYDALWHMVFVGFVFAMIFGHAPIVFPAILGVPIPYSRAFYLPLALLHLFLALRVLGDGLGDMALRRWGGMGDALTIVAYLGMLMVQVRFRK